MGSDNGLAGLNSKLRWLFRVSRDIGIRKLFKSLSWLLSYMFSELRLHVFDKLWRGNGTPLDCNMYGALLRAGANIRAVASMGGSFITTMGTLLPWDATVRSQQIHLAIRQDLLQRNKLLMQDDGDGDHGCMYEAGAFTHTESVVLYDPTDTSVQKIIKEFNATMNDASIHHKVGGTITSFGPQGAAAFFAPMMNYDSYTQRIKQVFDPANSAESSFYTNASFRRDPEQQALDQEVRRSRIDMPPLQMSDKARTGASQSEMSWLEKRGYAAMAM